MSKFQVPAVLTRASSMVDGGLSIGFHTKEIESIEKALIMEHHNLSGWLIFADNELKDEELPKEDAEVNTKSPSQRLRSVLYVLWDQNGVTEDFEVYYRHQMEKIIDHIKEKLV